MRTQHCLYALLSLMLGVGNLPAEMPRFEAVTIDPAAASKACYAVTVADVDGDRRDDIVVVTEDQVLWYRNPEWDKHVILDNQTELDNVCIAPLDIDGDGWVDFALGAGWTRVGTVQWISRGKEKQSDQLWNVYPIGREPWLHRMRFANVLDKDRPQLVISPLNAVNAPGVKLTAFEIPEDPREQRWPATVLDATLNRMHNHWHLDRNDDDVAETLTASQEGIHLVRRKDDGEFTKTKLSGATEGDSPQQSGAGEIKTGYLKGGRSFIATIEPMHGTSVVVYTDPFGDGGPSGRHVLDNTLAQGHAIWPADLDDDGTDELVVGHREAGNGPVRGPGVYIYDCTDEAGTTWKKHVLDDGGVAVEDLLCHDFNDDGLLDIVAVGRATLNVKLYLNQGEPSAN
ncbi:FG-GAP repeat protein [Maioricimonas rarisocia]|uniref:FG-GAP repeat protein n=1 Tax=Maioricimonas rarisocia TaxID=2528026 RepID=A0A517Z6D0_9PLAN|nr:VCBS repeat-containing protein [Maioricimonas rarisocia]QDU37989.1 FG-GAP repeat protein [Maioricimonas rarisocia]